MTTLQGTLMETHESELLKAQRHLSRRDAVLKQLIRQVGPVHPAAQRRRLQRAGTVDHLSANFHQGGTAIGERPHQKPWARGHSAQGDPEPHPATRVLRAAGMSANKVRCLRELAEKVDSKAVPLARFPELA